MSAELPASLSDLGGTNVDELTPGQLEELRGDLLSLKGELQSLIEGLSDETQPVEPDPAIGRISRMDAIQIQQMAKASKLKATQRLQQVEAALRRYEADEYGECHECGADIGRPRLKARPEAPFCLHCQSRRERGG